MAKFRATLYVLSTYRLVCDADLKEAFDWLVDGVSCFTKQINSIDIQPVGLNQILHDTGLPIGLPHIVNIFKVGQSFVTFIPSDLIYYSQCVFSVLIYTHSISLRADNRAKIAYGMLNYDNGVKFDEEIRANSPQNGSKQTGTFLLTSLGHHQSNAKMTAFWQNVKVKWIRFPV